jgi:hypothetical protein
MLTILPYLLCVYGRSLLHLIALSNFWGVVQSFVIVDFPTLKTYPKITNPKHQNFFQEYILDVPQECCCFPNPQHDKCFHK